MTELEILRAAHEGVTMRKATLTEQLLKAERDLVDISQKLQKAHEAEKAKVDRQKQTEEAFAKAATG